MAKYLFTSESVTEGHPDKICDNISDAVLDEILKQDPYGRVACDSTCITHQFPVMGGITTPAERALTLTPAMFRPLSTSSQAI